MRNDLLENLNVFKEIGDGLGLPFYVADVPVEALFQDTVAAEVAAVVTEHAVISYQDKMERAFAEKLKIDPEARNYKNETELSTKDVERESTLTKIVRAVKGKGLNNKVHPESTED